MFDGKLHEECGVFGVFSPCKQNLPMMVYYGLYALQHRGQESAGMSVSDGEKIRTHKAMGLVHEAFPEKILDRLGEGHLAVGHVRYSTTGAPDVANAQPIAVHHFNRTLSVVHNGNLTNVAELRQELEKCGSIFHSSSDTEVIAHLVTSERISGASLADALSRTMTRLKGAYSLILMTENELVAAKDENGFRPLCYGKTEDGSYVIASEDCALSAAGAEKIREIDPGEILTLTRNGVCSDRSHCGKVKPALCIFEFIYFARPDSVIAGCPVHDARLRAGAFLADEHPVDADVVIGVPDSGLDAAIGYSRRSGIPYGLGFIKNKYVGRSFIAPSQSAREGVVRIKLNPIAETVRGKRVIMIDDSIVRGTTSRRIVSLLREAGATEVHLRISSPPFLHPCYFGTDIDSEENLLASNFTRAEICQMIGADSLGFLGCQYLPYLISEDGKAGYCAACFDGNYPTEVPKNTQKDKFE